MEYHPFPAQLVSSYNNVSVFGQAAVLADENGLTFTGEFIPLLPLGFRAAVRWITGTEVMATFEGEVYLSAPQLVRLVGVDAELVAAARAIFACNVRFAASWRPAAPAAGHSADARACQVLYLSEEHLSLLASGTAAEGEEVSLSLEVDFLTLRHLGLLVERRLPLKQGETLLLCRVLPMEDANRIALSAYSARLRRQHNI